MTGLSGHNSRFRKFGDVCNLHLYLCMVHFCIHSRSNPDANDTPCFTGVRHRSCSGSGCLNNSETETCNIDLCPTSAPNSDDDTTNTHDNDDHDAADINNDNDNIYDNKLTMWQTCLIAILAVFAILLMCAICLFICVWCIFVFKPEVMKGQQFLQFGGHTPVVTLEPVHPAPAPLKASRPLFRVPALNPIIRPPGYIHYDNTGPKPVPGCSTKRPKSLVSGDSDVSGISDVSGVSGISSVSDVSGTSDISRVSGVKEDGGLSVVSGDVSLSNVSVKV